MFGQISKLKNHFIFTMTRNDYESLFIRHGISRHTLCGMTDIQFRSTLHDLLRSEDESFHHDESSSHYRYVSQPVVPQYEDDDEAIRIAIMNSLEDQTGMNSAQSDEQLLRYAQNAEYAEACAQANIEDVEEEGRKHYEVNAAIIEEEERHAREADVIGRYYRLTPEPTTGVTIAAIVKGERLTRRFGTTEQAINIYSWVAGENNMSAECDTDLLHFGEFELRRPAGAVINPDQTLEEQSLTGRVLLDIHEL